MTLRQFQKLKIGDEVYFYYKQQENVAQVLNKTKTGVVVPFINGDELTLERHYSMVEPIKQC